MKTLYRVGDYLNVEFTDPDEWQNHVQSVSYTHLTLPTTPYV